jgi:hypothetical protein
MTFLKLDRLSAGVPLPARAGDSQLRQHRTGDRSAGWKAGEAKGAEDVGRGQKKNLGDTKEKLL